MIKKGDSVRLVIPQKYMGREGYSRWHGMTGVAAHDAENSYCEVRFDRKVDFWESATAVFGLELVQLGRALTPLEADIQSYIRDQFAELGIA